MEIFDTGPMYNPGEASLVIRIGIISYRYLECVALLLLRINLTTGNEQQFLVSHLIGKNICQR
jgi:hypothetical protein